MRKLFYGISACALVVAMAFSPQPAFALPTCEQEVSIRCHGYNVQGRPRLDIYYDSYEECVTAEQPARCGTQYDPYASLTGHPVDIILRKAKTLSA